jgi:CheY-like chemotaxis protein
MSGMVTPQFHREALNAGCDDCLDKPIDFERLEKLVKQREAIATLSC